MLECAVILNWEDLMQAAANSGLIQIEYPTGPSDSLEYLKIWSSGTRGYWKLVCEYQMCALPLHARGLSFSNGYYSGDLAQMLEVVMQHQDTFVRQPRGHGLIQIHTPTAGERVAADTSMGDVLDLVASDRQDCGRLEYEGRLG